MRYKQAKTASDDYLSAYAYFDPKTVQKQAFSLLHSKSGLLTILISLVILTISFLHLLEIFLQIQSSTSGSFTKHVCPKYTCLESIKVPVRLKSISTLE